MSINVKIEMSPDQIKLIKYILRAMLTTAANGKRKVIIPVVAEKHLPAMRSLMQLLP